MKLFPLRQVAAEVIALAVCDLFPGAQLIGSQVTDVGFSYDFALQQPLNEMAIPFIEEKVRGIIKNKLPIETLEMVRSNAQELLRHHEQSLRADLLEECPDQLVTLIKIGTFFDLCPVVEIKNTEQIGYVKVQSIEKIDDFVRIHATAFPEKKELTNFLKKFERAKKKQHHFLEKTLEYFSFSPELTWLPKGVVLRELIVSWWKEEFRRLHGKLSASIPGQSVEATHKNILKRLKPPLEKQSLILGEWTWHSPSDTTYPFFRGLFTVSKHYYDMIHIFFHEKNVFEEITSCLQFILKSITLFGFEYRWCFKSRDKPSPKYISILEECGIKCDFERDRTMANPRIEVRWRDVLDQEWQGPYLEIDERKHLIKLSAIGSLERCIALLIERHQNFLPMWLAPEQVRVIAVKKESDAYAMKVCERFAQEKCRVALDEGSGNVKQRLSQAIKEGIPFVAIVGDAEEKENSITLRWRNDKTKKLIMSDAMNAVLTEMEA